MVRRSVFVVSCGLCLVTLRSNGWAQGTDTTSAAKLGHDSLASVSRSPGGCSGSFRWMILAPPFP